MKNKINLGLVSILMSLVIPTTALGAVDAALNATAAYTTGTDSQFDVVLTNYTASADISVLTFADTNANDIKSASFLDKSGWVQLTPYQSGTDVLAKYISDTGFTVNGQRVITMRVNFRTPKTYIVGYSLTSLDGKVLSSAAMPLTVTGGQVQGVATNNNVTFTRGLKNGSTGADVNALQNRLTAEGVYTGPITGYFGNMTRAGVIKYQTLKGISPANGVVGPQTLAALNQ